ncbi:MAG TPA: hypothetical protein V6D17_11015 [Candidatus Obscuribacterales bacterium]
MCWRTQLKDLLSLKWLKSAKTESVVEEEENKPELKMIWRDTLTRLEAYTPPTEALTVSHDVADQIKEAQKAREKVLEDIASKQKASKTAHDLKSWWGQAVATWDPEDAKNIDTIEKKMQGPKGSHWQR